MQMMAELKDRETATVSYEPPTMAESLGDFRMVREIGRGGMGGVYEAEQRSLRRRVAPRTEPISNNSLFLLCRESPEISGNSRFQVRFSGHPTKEPRFQLRDSSA